MTQTTAHKQRTVQALEVENTALRMENIRLRSIVEQQERSQSDPLAAARRRGAAYMTAHFADPDNLTLAAASTYSGRSDRVINQDRNRGSLYALVLEGNTRGFRYPKWQFDVPLVRLRPILDVLASAGAGCWLVHSFLTSPHVRLNGISPSQAIADDTFPLEVVAETARARVDPHQGAS